MQTVSHAEVTDERGTKKRRQPQDLEEQEDTPRQKGPKVEVVGSPDGI